MINSWDNYYTYYKQFDFKLFDIFIFKEFKDKIINLGYREADRKDEFSLQAGQYFEDKNYIKITHDQPTFLTNIKFKDTLDIDQWKIDAYILLGLDESWIKESILDL